MFEMIDQLKTFFKEAGDDSELWDVVAKCLFTQYQAMIKAGFTPEQSMEYLLKQGSFLHLK